MNMAKLKKSMLPLEQENALHENSMLQSSADNKHIHESIHKANIQHFL